MMHKQNSVVKVFRGYDTTPTSNNVIMIRFVKKEWNNKSICYQNKKMCQLIIMTSQNGCKLDSSNQSKMWPLCYFSSR